MAEQKNADCRCSDESQFADDCQKDVRLDGIWHRRQGPRSVLPETGVPSAIYGGFIVARRFDLDEFSDGLD